MQIEVQLYGGLRQRVGERSLALEVSDEARVADVLAALVERVPQLAGKLGGVACAVNDEIVNGTHRIEKGATVALLPPVSGGHSGRWLSPDPLHLDTLLAETFDERCGALIVFSGDIRTHNDGRDDVVAIEYEAHESIAARELKTIEEEVLREFAVHRCRIQHRLGRVEVGQSSVLVVCRAAHRDDAFRGARYAIDELKVRVPLWKCEHYRDGSSKYLDGTPLPVPGGANAQKEQQ